MTRLPVPALLCAILLFPSVVAADEASPSGRWLGPDGQPLPFTDHDEALEFLRKAEIIGWQELTSGTNRPSKVFLEKDGVRANAIFRSVDIRQKHARLETRIIPNFHDSHIYECAAYEVARALEIDAVPPCVKRSLELKPGTLQLWVEDAMMEKDRFEQGKEPPVPLQWVRQKQTMRLFDALIYNFDRNQTNMLIDADWKLWFVDHTRSFRRENKIDSPSKIIWVERQVWQKVQELEKKKLSRMKRYATGAQISSLLKRRDQLVEHIQGLIDQKGEAAVIFDAGATDAAPELLEAAAGVEDDYPEKTTLVLDGE